jgi:hypothetical protein
MTQPIQRCQPAVRPFTSSVRWLDEETPSASTQQTQKTPPSPAITSQATSNKSPDPPKLDRSRRDALFDPNRRFQPQNPFNLSDLDPEDQAEFKKLSPDEQQETLDAINHDLAIREQALAERNDEEVDFEEMAMEDRAFDEENPALRLPNYQVAERDLGYWGEDEDDEFALVEDDDDDWDSSMMTAVAESELELVREVRQYMRVAAWDMPLLGRMSGHLRAFSNTDTRQNMLNRSKHLQTLHLYDSATPPIWENTTPHRRKSL